MHIHKVEPHRGEAYTSAIVTQVLARRRMSLLLPFCLAASLMTGCDEDTRPRTLIDNLRIVGIAPVLGKFGGVDDQGIETAEVAPGDNMKVQVLVADPEQQAGSMAYAIIGCTSYSGVIGCLEEVDLVDEADIETEELSLDEEDYQRYFQRFVRAHTYNAQGISSVFDDEFIVPYNYKTLILDLGYTEINASVTVLVCRPGLCPIIDELEAYRAGEAGTRSGEELLQIVSHPDTLLSGLPINGVTLGRKSYRVSLDTEPNHNPKVEAMIFTGCYEALQSTGENRTCQLTVEFDPDVQEDYLPSTTSTTRTQEAVVVRFYSTAGEMGSYFVQLYSSDPAKAYVNLVLPPVDETPETIAIYAVAVDSRSGLGYGFATLSGP